MEILANTKVFDRDSSVDYLNSRQCKVLHMGRRTARSGPSEGDEKAFRGCLEILRFTQIQSYFAVKCLKNCGASTMRIPRISLRRFHTRHIPSST